MRGPKPVAASNPVFYRATIIFIAASCVYYAIQGIRTGQQSLFFLKATRSNAPFLFWLIVLLLAVLGPLLIALGVITGVL